MKIPIKIEAVLVDNNKTRDGNEYVQSENNHIVPRFFNLKFLLNILK